MVLINEFFFHVRNCHSKYNFKKDGQIFFLSLFFKQWLSRGWTSFYLKSWRQCFNEPTDCFSRQASFEKMKWKPLSGHRRIFAHKALREVKQRCRELRHFQTLQLRIKALWKYVTSFSTDIDPVFSISDYCLDLRSSYHLSLLHKFCRDKHRNRFFSRKESTWIIFYVDRECDNKWTEMLLISEGPIKKPVTKRSKGDNMSSHSSSFLNTSSPPLTLTHPYLPCSLIEGSYSVWMSDKGQGVIILKVRKS